MYVVRIALISEVASTILEVIMMQFDYSDLKLGTIEARSRTTQFEKQWMTWLTLASAGGLALMLSFSTGMANPNHTLPALLPAYFAFLLGMAAAGLAFATKVKEEMAFKCFRNLQPVANICRGAGIQARRTMQLAQKVYTGTDFGDAFNIFNGISRWCDPMLNTGPGRPAARSIFADLAATYPSVSAHCTWALRPKTSQLFARLGQNSAQFRAAFMQYTPDFDQYGDNVAQI